MKEAAVEGVVDARFEALLGQLASTFVALPAEKIDGSLADALKLVVECFDLDRSTLGQFGNEDGTHLAITHSWARPGLPMLALSGGQASESLPARLAARLLRGETVGFTRVDELPPPFRALLVASGQRSNLSLPVRVAGEVVGALAFGTFHREQVWGERLVGRLRLVADLFGSVLSRQRYDAEVRRLTSRLEAENVYLREEIATTNGFREIVGASPALQGVLYKIEQVAPTDAPVMILGETGTGKELFARAVHDNSPRHNRPLVKVNCAALPPTLIESELFGHVKGAFTGATAARAGRFVLADGGTIFLDEIGEMAIDMQAKLLRVLQEGEVEPVGSSTVRTVDVRVIAATNRDLHRAMKDGRFRSDLYYRLNVFPIELPALRERREDIPLLVRHFVDRGNKRLGRRIGRIPLRVLEQLVAHDWPGNVRELQNVVDRAMILSPGDTLELEAPSAVVGAGVTADTEVSAGHEEAPAQVRTSAMAALTEVEREHIVRVLEMLAWRINGPGHAAEVLGLHPSTLRHRMKKLGIERP